jgi:opacity protein-like surface antigen
MRNLVALLVAVSLSSGLPVAATAQDDDKWLASIFGGYSASLERGAPSGSFGGLANGFLMLNPGIGLGVELGHQRLGTENTSWIPPGDTQSRPLEIGRNSWQLTAQVRARGEVANFRPYVDGGFGLYLLNTAINDPSYATGGSNSQFGFNVGAGVIVSGEGKKWGFGIDGRWHDIIQGRIDKGDLDILALYAGFVFWGG